MSMGIATDGLNRLFSNQSDVYRLIRDVALGLFERVPALKGMSIREAAGPATCQSCCAVRRCSFAHRCDELRYPHK